MSQTLDIMVGAPESGDKPTAGDTTDWTYGEYGIPSFTIELRPRGAADGGFILPASQIQPTFEENKAATIEFIETLVG